MPSVAGVAEEAIIAESKLVYQGSDINQSSRKELFEKVEQLVETCSLTDDSLKEIYNAAFSKGDQAGSNLYILLKAKLYKPNQWGDWAPDEGMEDPPAAVNLAKYHGFEVVYFGGQMYCDVWV